MNLDNRLLNQLIKTAEQAGVQKIVAGAVITLDDKILFLERAKGEFKEGLIELPSGGINANETIIQGLVREVKEETGLNVLSVTDYLGYFDYLSKSGRKTRQFNFKVITEPGEIKINPVEHNNFFTASDLNDLNISEEVKNILSVL